MNDTEKLLPVISDEESQSYDAKCAELQTKYNASKVYCCVQFREETNERIISYITEPNYTSKLVLMDKANDIGMHESTVSRVTTNKYVHTPRGIFELKYFFNSGISMSDGDSLASESVKLKIKTLVSGEDPKNPLSDQRIVELLKKDGIQIARRTVAKYRDMLKILPSSKRKKIF